MDIGNKIKQLRQRSSLTQEQLANQLGVSAQSISKWENSVSMPDITLLPMLAEIFGVSIDELFDLTVEEKCRRIENSIHKQKELPGDIFKEYEDFLLSELEKGSDGYRSRNLLAYLYHHRMEADAGRVRKYACEAIMMCPEERDCHWLLDMAWGQRVWDWNRANHAENIDFYKKVIENDKVEPKTPLTYYYLIDNLLADCRTEEAEYYVKAFEKLPSHNPILVPIYRAHIALLEHDVEKSEKIIEEGLLMFSHNDKFLFEVAQYYAGQAQYEKAIEFYKKYWEITENRPRYTDAPEGIATIYGILGKSDKVIEAYDVLIKVLKEEWGFEDDDISVMEVEAKKSKLLREGLECKK